MSLTMLKLVNGCNGNQQNLKFLTEQMWLLVVRDFFQLESLILLITGNNNAAPWNGFRRAIADNQLTINPQDRKIPSLG